MYLTNETRAADALVSAGLVVERLGHGRYRVRKEGGRWTHITPTKQGRFGPLYDMGSIKNIIDRLTS